MKIIERVNALSVSDFERLKDCLYAKHHEQGDVFEYFSKAKTLRLRPIYNAIVKIEDEYGVQR